MRGKKNYVEFFEMHEIFKKMSWKCFKKYVNFSILVKK